MKITVVSPDELTTAELDRWRSLQRESPHLQNPFLSAQFVLAVSRARGNVRVGVLEQDGEIVGFFPYEVHGRGIGRAVGVGVSDCQGLIHGAGVRPDPRKLLRECGLAVWEFDHLLAEQTFLSPCHAVPATSPTIGLGDGYENYLQRKRETSKKTIKATLYKQRKLGREVGPLRFSFDVRDPDVLRMLMRWKSAQYRGTGQYDRFAQGWIVHLVEDLLASRARECAGTLSVLYAGDEPVAAHFGLRSESVLSCWFPAYDRGYAKYSPGLSLHLEMAAAADGEGIRYLDLGRGDEEYKESLKNGEVMLAEGWLERPSPTAAVRRVQRAPRWWVKGLFRSHPQLRVQAHRTLGRLGRLRNAGPRGANPG